MLKKFLVNSGSNVSLFVVQLCVTFVMTPVFVRNLGNYDYGIWEIIVTVTGYMGLLDMGILPATSRFASLHKAKEEKNLLQQVYCTALAFMLVLGLLAMIVFFATGMFYPQAISQHDTDLERYSLLLIIVGIQLIISMPGKITDSFLSGYQKFYTKNNITIVIVCISNYIFYQFMTPANAIILLASVTAIGLAVKYIFFYLLLWIDKDYPVYFTSRHVELSALKKLLNFGIKNFIASVAIRVQRTSIPLIIGLIAGVEKIIYFIIPSRLTGYVYTMNTVLSQTCTPMFTQLFGEGREDELKRTYLLISKTIFAITTLVCTGLLAYGDDFLSVWLGQEYAIKGYIVIICATVTTLLNSISPLSGKYLVATDTHGLLAKTESIRAVLRIILASVLIYYFGYVGAAYSLFIGPFFTTYVMFKSCNYLKIRVSSYLVYVVVPSILPALALALALQYFSYSWGIESLPALLLFSISGALIYWIIYYLGSLNEDEKQILGRIYRKLAK